MQGSHSSHSSLARTHTSSSSLPSDPSTPRDLLHDRLVPARPSPPQAAPLPLACLSALEVFKIHPPSSPLSIRSSVCVFLHSHHPFSLHSFVVFPIYPGRRNTRSSLSQTELLAVERRRIGWEGGG
ncbi:hypothetical protein OF846_001494 [Rhodotorula toruloides]|nr:hypothetical protein OF846_001494 [Rhodotorula toruloides]